MEESRIFKTYSLPKREAIERIKKLSLLPRDAKFFDGQCFFAAEIGGERITGRIKADGTKLVVVIILPLAVQDKLEEKIVKEVNHLFRRHKKQKLNPLT